MEGLSAKSVVVSFLCQLIVFLYLLDNETSWMILASSGIGCCIEFWKIGKAMHIEIDRSGRIPMLRFRDRDSYASNKTKEYDDIAMKYLSYVLFFLVICFSIYSLMYERHKSWYSWILSSLTSCVYMFGFIMMCPQLFINYKLKSVAHLPWRQMTYKFLNTIIDDLFAFVIKMPTLHRLSVFRDDLIFLIYLYQRWIYPVDKKRINEFGFGGEDDNDQTAAVANEDDKKTN
ncbi:Cleft lip and palate transmembrane protein 1-like protein [Hibiscus syriacus]|uniref:Cleft lip and palate transmembrane protein 1-like protein n=2 Tax=Hibiscus syriacus TaxID=106335 RepID=A0A6A2ZDU3_HIBSY|nr:Cleft lip and palate transmembrane protein 1-like protein [Hibiscus syriacus]